MAKGQVINEGLGFNQLKTSESDSASKNELDFKNLGQIHQALCL